MNNLEEKYIKQIKAVKYYEKLLTSFSIKRQSQVRTPLRVSEYPDYYGGAFIGDDYELHIHVLDDGEEQIKQIIGDDFIPIPAKYSYRELFESVKEIDEKMENGPSNICSYYPCDFSNHLVIELLECTSGEIQKFKNDVLDKPYLIFVQGDNNVLDDIDEISDVENFAINPSEPRIYPGQEGSGAPSSNAYPAILDATGEYGIMRTGHSAVPATGLRWTHSGDVTELGITVAQNKFRDGRYRSTSDTAFAVPNNGDEDALSSTIFPNEHEISDEIAVIPAGTYILNASAFGVNSGRILAVNLTVSIASSTSPTGVIAVTGVSRGNYPSGPGVSGSLVYLPDTPNRIVGSHFAGSNLGSSMSTVIGAIEQDGITPIQASPRKVTHFPPGQGGIPPFTPAPTASSPQSQTITPSWNGGPANNTQTGIQRFNILTGPHPRNMTYLRQGFRRRGATMDLPHRGIPANSTWFYQVEAERNGMMTRSPISGHMAGANFSVPVSINVPSNIFLQGKQVEAMYVNGEEIADAFIKGRHVLSSSWGGDTIPVDKDPDFYGNLAPTNIGDYEIGCWNATVGAVLAPNNAGSAQWRIRPRQGVISVPAGSRLRFRTNSPWIYVVRIVGANNVIFRNPAQLHGSNLPDNEFEIQLSSSETGIALSLSSLPEVETDTTFGVWIDRLLNGDIYPEIYIVQDEPEPIKPPVINSFNATETLYEGEEIILSWNVEDADKLTLSDGMNSWEVEGNEYRIIAESTTTFTLTAENDDGTAEANVTVTVLPPQADVGWKFFRWTGVAWSGPLNQIQVMHGGTNIALGATASHPGLTDGNITSVAVPAGTNITGMVELDTPITDAVQVIVNLGAWSNGGLEVSSDGENWVSFTAPGNNPQTFQIPMYTST